MNKYNLCKLCRGRFCSWEKSSFPCSRCGVYLLYWRVCLMKIQANNAPAAIQALRILDNASNRRPRRSLVYGAMYYNYCRWMPVLCFSFHCWRPLDILKLVSMQAYVFFFLSLQEHSRTHIMLCSWVECAARNRKLTMQPLRSGDGRLTAGHISGNLSYQYAEINPL